MSGISRSDIRQARRLAPSNPASSGAWRRPPVALESASSEVWRCAFGFPAIAVLGPRASRDRRADAGRGRLRGPFDFADQRAGAFRPKTVRLIVEPGPLGPDSVDACLDGSPRSLRRPRCVCGAVAIFLCARPRSPCNPASSKFGSARASASPPRRSRARRFVRWTVDGVGLCRNRGQVGSRMSRLWRQISASAAAAQHPDAHHS